MKKFLTEEMKKQIIVYSISFIIALSFYLLVSKLPNLYKLMHGLFSIILPFIIGLLVAFLLNSPQKWFENKLKNIFPNTKSTKLRVISAIIVFILTILFLIFIIYVTIPAIIDSMEIFIENIGIYGNTIYSWMIQIAKQLHVSSNELNNMIADMDLSTRLSNYLTNLIPTIATYSVSFLFGLFDFILALIAGLYMLIDKEHLIRTCKKIVYATFDEEMTETIYMWYIDSQTIFQQYIVGTIVDGLIIGSVTYIGMLILRMPYAPLIGVIIGITNLIPIFGPFLGAIPVAFLLFLISPFKCLEFLIFIIILQQIDANVIKPIILGDQLGISGFWILFSVTLGGGLFGILGMFLAVPVFAIIYISVKRAVDKELYKKQIDINN